MFALLRHLYYAYPYFFIPAVVVSVATVSVVTVTVLTNDGSDDVVVVTTPTIVTPSTSTDGAECDQDPTCEKTDSPGKREGCVAGSGAIRFVITSGGNAFSIEFPASGGSGTTGGYSVTYDGIYPGYAV